MPSFTVDVSDKPYGWVSVCLVDVNGGANKLTLNADQQYAIANDAAGTITMKIHRKGDADFTSYDTSAAAITTTASGEANITNGRAIVIGPGIDYAMFSGTVDATITVVVGTRLFGYY